MTTAGETGISIGTLESLRETLRQTIEEKNKFEAKVVEDRTRIETRITELKKVVSDYTAELQSIGNTLETMHPDTKHEQLNRTHIDYQQFYTQPKASAGIPDDLRDMVKTYLSSSESASPLNISTSAVKQFFKGWVFPFVILVLILWLAIGWWQSQTRNKGQTPYRFRPVMSLYLPSLLPAAEACTVSNRIWEQAHDKETYIHATRMTQPPDSTGDASDTSKVYLAVLDLIQTLNNFGTVYCSGQNADILFNQTKDQWDYLAEQYTNVQPVPSVDASVTKDRQLKDSVAMPVRGMLRRIFRK